MKTDRELLGEIGQLLDLADELERRPQGEMISYEEFMARRKRDANGNTVKN